MTSLFPVTSGNSQDDPLIFSSLSICEDASHPSIFYIFKMYPTPDETAVLETVEAFMVKTMARYDSSHDALHGV